MVNAVEKQRGRIDILVNNAGVTQPIKVLDTTVKDWDRIFDINMKGVFFCSKAVVPVMLKQNYGRIVNMSSVAGKRGGGLFGGAAYSATKAGVLGFSKALAREVAANGVTVNSVAPGMVRTDIRGGIESIEEEVAAVICFLASEEAGYVTGEEIDVNGGSHMD